jgi:hypothetical protein
MMVADHLSLHRSTKLWKWKHYWGRLRLQYLGVASCVQEIVVEVMSQIVTCPAYLWLHRSREDDIHDILTLTDDLASPAACWPFA